LNRIEEENDKYMDYCHNMLKKTGALKGDEAFQNLEAT